MTVWPVSSLRLRLLSACLFGAAVSGCHAPTSAPVSVVPAATPAARRTVAAFSPTSVQRLPLYRQAAQACKVGQFRHAADLLSTLAASPALSPEQVAFCREQRDLCLRHLAAPLSPASPSSGASHPVSPLSPDNADCGPRALALVCQKLGRGVDVARLRSLAGTTERGTSLAGLAKACAGVGLKAEGVQVSREALSEVELPALAWVNQNHYVALLAVQGEGERATATIRDPNAAGEETLPRERLLRMCSGYLLLVHR